MKKLSLLIALALSLLLTGCLPSSPAPSDAAPEVPSTAPEVPSTVPEIPSTTPVTEATEPAPASKRDAIPFAQGQLYAVAYLGYQQMDSLDAYAAQYLDSDDLPVHYISGGDYYLIIPRYDGMALSLLVNDLETSESVLRFEDPSCEPFIVQCNVSDIFSDVTVRLTYAGETVEFSPFISLENGSVVAGDRGLVITSPTT